MKILRKLRGMFGIGVFWAVVWAPIGLAMATIQLFTSGFGLPTAALAVGVLKSGLMNGFATGFLFSGGLSLVYRRRSFADIRPSVIAGIGALAGAIPPLGVMSVTLAWSAFSIPLAAIVMAIGFGGSLGAATALGALKLAQAAPPPVGGADYSALAGSVDHRSESGR